jgi:hypothetical protein
MWHTRHKTTRGFLVIIPVLVISEFWPFTYTFAFENDMTFVPGGL